MKKSKHLTPEQQKVLDDYLTWIGPHPGVDSPNFNQWVAKKYSIPRPYGYVFGMEGKTW